jgi:chemosensory pili system protein ChpC
MTETTADPRIDDIRGVLIQVTGARLLMPNAAIAEVLSYADPDPVEGAPDWLLGQVRWRGWQLPLVAFSRLSGIAEEKPGLGNKMIVLKAIGGQGRIPFFAVLTQGFPRLVTVSRNGLVPVESDEALPTGVLGRVELNDDPALVPDVGRVESMIDEALAQAA